MPAVPGQLRKRLTQLQLAARRRPKAHERLVTSRRPPAELSGGQAGHVSFTEDVADLVHELARLLKAELGFEYLENPAAVIWDFTMQCRLEPSRDHRQDFVKMHWREPWQRTCFVAIEYLQVPQAIALHDILLLPPQDDRIPSRRHPSLFDDPADCFAAVPVIGTNYQRMAERAREQVRHELRLLRHGLHGPEGVHSRDLRFRVGAQYIFDDGAAGRTRLLDEADTLTLGSRLLTVAERSQLWSLQATATTKVERAVHRALWWLDQAELATEPLIELLYLFFALETVLGNDAEGTKADHLAFEQMRLSDLATGSFTDPYLVWSLYDQVRSVAVHGAELPPVDRKEVDNLGHLVRETLDHYWSLASNRGRRSRREVTDDLQAYGPSRDLAQWLLTHGGPGWRPYLEKIHLVHPLDHVDNPGSCSR